VQQQKAQGGWLTAEYSMLPYSTQDRKPRDISKASMTSSAPRKPQEQSGGGALAEALRRASEKGGRGKT